MAYANIIWGEYGIKNQSTLVCLKSGLACVAVFGESPDFLEKSCFSKTQESWFFGKMLILEEKKYKSYKKLLACLF